MRAAAYLFALSVLVLVPVAAWANGSSVAPTRLLLTAGSSSTYVLITNTSPVSQRYSVSAYRWDQTAANPIALTPTNDIVFFPGSFTLEPLRAQRIRIGTTTASGLVEKTYRIVVSELPPLTMLLASQSTGLGFTASFNIPIYLAPQHPIASGEITGIVVDRGNLRFTVRNTGNVHLVAKSMRVLGRGDVKTILSVENSAWFVLANGQRDFVMPLPAGGCAALRTVSIVVDAGTATFARSVGPERDCS